MLRRLAVPLALLATTVTGSAYAGPAASAACPLLTDPMGDAAPPLTTPAFDLVSGGLTSNRTDLIATIRVAELDLTEPLAANGLVYTATFELPGRLDDGPVSYQLRAVHRSGGADEFELLVAAPPSTVGPVSGTGYDDAGSITGVFDAAASAVRVVVPLALLGAQSKVTPGTVVTLTSIKSEFGVVVRHPVTERSSSFTEKTDEAVGSAPHTLGSTCSTPRSA